MPAKGRYKQPICLKCGKKKPDDLRKKPECRACAAIVKKLLAERRRYRARGADKRRKNRARHWANRTQRLKALRDRYARPEVGRRERSRQKRYYRKNRRRVIARTEARRRLLKKIAPHVLREYQRNYNRRNPYKSTTNTAHYRAKLAGAMPPWADRAAIDDVYALAELMSRLLGERYTVDHFYPLRGKTVSGLHVAGNLRVITERANRAKANHMPTAYTARKTKGRIET